MRHIKSASVFVLLVVCVGTFAMSAQAAEVSMPASAPAQQDGVLLQRLQQAAGGNVRVSQHAETGKVRFLATDPQQPVQRSAQLAANVSGEQAARDFLATYGTLFGVNDQARDLRTVRSRRERTDVVTRFQQTYNGVPVLGAELIVHTNATADVVSANGEIVPNIAIDTTPSITVAQAKIIATGALGKQHKLPAGTFTASEPQLWIFNPLTLGGPGVRRDALVWRMDVAGHAAGDPVRELVLVDAHIGAVALNFNQIAHGKDRRVCDEENVPDTEPFANYQCVPERYDRVEGQPPTGVADVDRAYDQHGAVYDYYFTNFNRDSIDGQGLPLLATVRYCPLPNDPADPNDDAYCPFQNAFWDGEQMTYGNGFIVDDVVAHELTHGVTDYESSLFYYYQSGAINESLSDVFGELFDLQYAPGGNDAPDVRWDLGEDLPDIGAIRDMQDPPRFGDPDRVRSLRYYNRQGDNGGVHINSGVNNKAAYLMTDGGTFNGQTIGGIGTYKTGRIYYVANTQYLLSASDYQDLADILPQACDVLAQPGVAITTAADCANVRKAVLATEMNQTPRRVDAEAPVCGVGQAPTNVFFDDLEDTNIGNWRTAATQPELSPINAWFYPQSASPPELWGGTSYATSGVNNFWGYNYGGFPGLTPPEELVPADYNIAMTRDVAVPANAYMHFRHSYDFDADLFDTYDGGVVEYSTDGGQTYQDAGALFTDNGYTGDMTPHTDNLLAGRDAFVDRSKGYTSTRADLGSLAGENVRFRFRIGTDSTFNDYGWFIDDIRIYTCSASYTNRVFMPMLP